MDGLGDLSLTDRKIIVGVDFGTTYSGVAWAETRRPDHIIVIDSWPSSDGSREGASSVKVPSELRYHGKGYEWGFQIPAIVERHHWFKLALNKRSGTSNSSGNNGDPEKLLRDYLTAVGEHLIYTLEQTLGAAFRTIPLEYVLTVPAIWTESAKAKTLKACQAAGFRTDAPISLVSEPEAAAMYALHRLDPHNLNIGDSFVLCDAGGGTVDLISYTITKLSPTLEIKEAAAGTGALCGSTYLNRSFGEFLTSKLGQEPGWDEETLAEAMERFESFIKKQYSPSTYSEATYSIPVSGLVNNEKIGIKRGKFHMKLNEMKALFEPIVKQVIKLVKDQIKSTNVKIKAVLLVGGFGQNSYLKQRLRSALGDNVEVMQPPHAWTAVVRGAVMKGLSNYDNKLAMVKVGPRVARKHYGIRLDMPFDSSIHSESSKYWNEFYGEHRARNCMSWFIKKGDPVVESVPSVIPFWRQYRVSQGIPTTHTTRVYCDSESKTAPAQQNNNVVELVSLEANLNSIFDPFGEEEGEDGAAYYVLKGSIEAAYGSASTEYTLKYKGKRYKSVTAEYV